jgi:hypothetical protein
VARFRELKIIMENKPNNKGVCHHIVALPFALKSMYLKANEEEELWKLKYFTMQKI